MCVGWIQQKKNFEKLDKDNFFHKNDFNLIGQVSENQRWPLESESLMSHTKMMSNRNADRPFLKKRNEIQNEDWFRVILYFFVWLICMSNLVEFLEI